MTTRPATQHDYARRILRVLVHIQRHLDEELPLDELAAVAHFSPFHFHRLFRGMVGESVKQHVRRLRLERAAHHLKHSDRPVTMIALDAGYEAHAAFARAFRRTFGQSPTEFRLASAGPEIARPGRARYSGGEDVRFDPLEPPAMKVEIRSSKSMRVAFLRHVGPYDEVGRTWERLTDWAGAECFFGPEVQLFAMCWDDPEVTSPEKVRYDACITVDDSVEAAGEIGVQTVPGGRFACVLHEGPYDRLGDTYAALLGRWFPTSGYEPGDPPCLEFYLNEPDATEPEDLLTDVWVRLHE